LLKCLDKRYEKKLELSALYDTFHMYSESDSTLYVVDIVCMGQYRINITIKLIWFQWSTHPQPSAPHSISQKPQQHTVKCTPYADDSRVCVAGKEWNEVKIHLENTMALSNAPWKI